MNESACKPLTLTKAGRVWQVEVEGTNSNSSLNESNTSKKITRDHPKNSQAEGSPKKIPRLKPELIDLTKHKKPEPDLLDLTEETEALAGIPQATEKWVASEDPNSFFQKFSEFTKQEIKTLNVAVQVSKRAIKSLRYEPKITEFHMT